MLNPVLLILDCAQTSHVNAAARNAFAFSHTESLTVVIPKFKLTLLGKPVEVALASE
jgi:hypothetical protein